MASAIQAIVRFDPDKLRIINLFDTLELGGESMQFPLAKLQATQTIALPMGTGHSVSVTPAWSDPPPPVCLSGQCANNPSITCIPTLAASQCVGPYTTPTWNPNPNLPSPGLGQGGFGAFVAVNLVNPGAPLSQALVSNGEIVLPPVSNGEPAPTAEVFRIFFQLAPGFSAAELAAEGAQVCLEKLALTNKDPSALESYFDTSLGAFVVTSIKSSW
jgi:hypothetical protein